MGQEIAHGDASFAGLGELRPVPCHRRVEIDAPGLDEAERADCRDRLPDGVEVDDRVAVPGPRARGVGVAGPQIDDRLAPDVHGEGRAHLGARDEDLAERRPYALEPGRADAVHAAAEILPISRRHGGTLRDLAECP
jgi:hypothetical protein